MGRSVMNNSDSKDKNKKISIKHRPVAREDIFSDKDKEPQVSRNLYLTPKKKKLPPWLLPLIIIAVLLLGVFVLLPSLLTDSSDENPAATEQPQATEPVIPLAGVGDRAVLKRSSALVFTRADKTSPHITELLLNESVLITDTAQKDWLGVELEDGLRGYVERSALTADTSSLSLDNVVMKLVIRDPFKRVMSHARGGTLLLEAPMGTILYADYHNSGLVRVKLPEGKLGWMNTQGVFLLNVNEDLPVPDDFQKSFIFTAIAFENTAYIPGGQTRNGISTAGVVRLSALLNGLELPRTAGQLMEVGEKVEFPKTSAQPAIKFLRPGDLVFFHEKADDQSLDLMALCLTEERLLLSLNNKATIQIIDFDSVTAEELSERIMVARRLNESSQ